MKETIVRCFPISDLKRLFEGSRYRGRDRLGRLSNCHFLDRLTLCRLAFHALVAIRFFVDLDSSPGAACFLSSTRFKAHRFFVAAMILFNPSGLILRLGLKERCLEADGSDSPRTHQR